MGREAAVGERTFPATTLTLKSDDSGAKERGGGRPPPRNPLRGMQRLAAFGHWRWETAGMNPACIRTSSTEGLIDWCVQAHSFQPFPAGGEEPGGLQAVEHPVVEREAEVH